MARALSGQPKRIELALQSGDSVLVQVNDPVNLMRPPDQSDLFAQGVTWRTRRTAG